MEKESDSLTEDDRNKILDIMNNNILHLCLVVPYKKLANGENIIVERNKLFSIHKDDVITECIVRTFDIYDIPFIDKTKIGLIVYHRLNEKSPDMYKFFVDKTKTFRIYYYKEDYESEFIDNNISVLKLRRQSINVGIKFEDIKTCLDQIFIGF